MLFFCIALLFLRCMTSSDYSAYLVSSPEERNNQYTNTNQFVVLTDLIYPDIPYNGVNLGHFPENARNWIMERPYFSYPNLKIWWDDDNNRIFAESARGYGSFYGSPDIVKYLRQSRRLEL